MISDFVEAIYPNLAYIDHNCYKQHLLHFPQGQCIVLHENEIISYCSSIIVKEEEIAKNMAWLEIVDNLSHIHDNNGNYLYITEICVSNHYRGRHLATLQLEEKKRLCRELSLKGILLVSRLSHFAEKKDEALTPENYVKMVSEKKILDYCLLLYMRQGFEALNIIKNYLPDDAGALGFGQCFLWRNS